MFTFFPVLLVFANPLALIALVVTAGAVQLVRHAGFKRALMVALVSVSALAVAWHYFTLHLALHPVPDALGVSSMLYSKEELWGTGFSGGDNETGLRVFPLDAQVARQIEEQGLRFLDTMAPDAGTIMPGRHGDRWRNEYTEWVRTPMPAAILEDPGELRPPSLHTFLSSHGFGIDIDPAIARRIDAILQSPGSFYAKGRYGYLVISPRERLVVYMYAG